MIRMATLAVLAVVTGCSTPDPASAVLEPLQRLAAAVTGFPEQAGSYHRIAWEFDTRSVTAHYRCADAPLASAWITRFVCEAQEQDPFSYTRTKRLLAGLSGQGEEVSDAQAGREVIADCEFNVVRFKSREAETLLRGIIAATVLGPEDDKYHVLVARARAPEGATPLDLGPLLEAVLRD